MLRSTAEPDSVLTALPDPSSHHMQLVAAPVVPRLLAVKSDAKCQQHWRLSEFGDGEGLFSLEPFRTAGDGEERRVCTFSGGAVLSSPEELPTLSFRVVPIFNASGSPGKQWKELGEELGVPVQKVSAESGEGVHEALASIVEVAVESWGKQLTVSSLTSSRRRAKTAGGQRRDSMHMPGSTRSSRGSVFSSDDNAGSPNGLRSVKEKIGSLFGKLLKNKS